jgi:hypothetical protein
MKEMVNSHTFVQKYVGKRIMKRAAIPPFPTYLHGVVLRENK